MEIIGFAATIAFFAPAFYLIVHHDIALARQERAEQHGDQAFRV